MTVAVQPLTDTERVDRQQMNSVLEKVQLILEAFSVDDSELSLAELVRRTGATKPTVHRLAQQLIAWGLLERSSGTNYRLGLRLFEIGQRVPRQRILREAALPFMEDLYVSTQETVHFAVLEGVEVLYIEKIVGHRGVRSESRIAGRLPIHCTATGKAILAFSPESLLRCVVQSGLEAVTPRTVTSPVILRSQLEKARAAQFAVESEETRLGYSSLATPVFGPDRQLVGALSVTAPTYRWEVSRLAPAVQTAAAGIARVLASTTM